MRDLFDHPHATQFYGREFRAGLEAAGLHVQKWRQWGEWGITPALALARKRQVQVWDKLVNKRPWRKSTHESTCTIK